MIATEEQQKQFDDTIKGILTPDIRLTPSTWLDLFCLIYQAEKTDISIDSLSVMTKYNYNL